MRPPSEAFWSRENWEAFLTTTRAAASVHGDVMPTNHVQLLEQPIADPLDPGSHSVRIALEKLREHDDRMECGLFNVAIDVGLPNDALGPLRLERVKRSYHLAGFMTMGGASTWTMRDKASGEFMAIKKAKKHRLKRRRPKRPRR